MLDPLRPAVRRDRLRLAGLVAVGIAAAVVVVGLVGRGRADHQLAAWTEDQAVPTVALAKVDGGGERDLVLPGTVQAIAGAEIHARVTGYLKRWHVDIGQAVQAGQLLAEIDTPDLDQQVLQARADLATAEANERLSRTTAARWSGLVAQDAVSRQEADEKAGDHAAKASAVNAARANLDRLLAQAGFKRVTAPFAGVITSRSTDVGALIGAGGGSAGPLFTLADERRLRVYVNAPQNLSGLIQPGAAADISVPEYPGEAFPAVVVRSARAVDPRTGTVLFELQLDNGAGRLKPGSYGQVAFHLTAPATTTRVPATAIQFRHEGPTVATVGADGRVKVHPIRIARDLGATVEVGAGLAAGARVIDNPPETLVDGDQVRIAGDTVEKAAAPKAAPPKAGHARS
jgi:RND family efflux transporter MFP subunit